jgi:hypothetical protein
MRRKGLLKWTLAALLISSAHSAKALNATRCVFLAKAYEFHLQDPATLSQSQAFDAAFFLGYVAGFVGAERSFTLPRESTLADWADIVGRFAKGHPELHDRSRAECVFKALTEAFQQA